MCNKKRCSWVNLKNKIYIDYHDNEWSKPLYDDKKLLEIFILECFQAGLSWECVLNKREYFRLAYDNFDVDKIIRYDSKKIEELYSNNNIIRNKKKIIASIKNTKVFKQIQQEFGTFSTYLWNWTNNQIIYENDKVKSDLSDKIFLDLKKRGMKFIGSITVYSYLQAVGVIYAHQKGCYLEHKN